MHTKIIDNIHGLEVEKCLDEISVKQYGDIVLGAYGGNISAGAKRTKMVH